MNEQNKPSYYAIIPSEVRYCVIPGTISRWISSSIILLLLIHNIKNTIKNSNIEIEGIPLKKKDATFGTADWASESEMQEYLSIGKRDGNTL